MSDDLDSIPGNGRTLVYRMGQVEKDVASLERKVDRVLWALVTLTITLAGSSIIFAITVLSLRGAP